MLLAAAPALVAAQAPPPLPPGIPRPPRQDDEVRLPNGKLQRDEILKAEYQKSLADAKQLVQLAGELKKELDRNDQYVLSVSALKKTEEIEKLARRIHDRMKHS